VRSRAACNQVPHKNGFFELRKFAGVCECREDRRLRASVRVESVNPSPTHPLPHTFSHSVERTEERSETEKCGRGAVSHSIRVRTGGAEILRSGDLKTEADEDALRANVVQSPRFPMSRVRHILSA